MQAQIDRANTGFWNELCGTHLARSARVDDDSPEALRHFDEAYFRMYPYLLPLIRPERMTGLRVLEIGLGFGSVGQKLAEAGAHYHGLDIADGPVRITNHRLRLLGCRRSAAVGSALDVPFPPGLFDFVVSIGCLHHTGDVRRCFAEVYRVLRPGGTAVLMLYNKYSYRRWLRYPAATLGELWREKLGGGSEPRNVPAGVRKLWDRNVAGEAAPETVLLSVGQLRRMLAPFEQLSFTRQTGRTPVRRRWSPRNWLRPLLFATVGRWLGLDIYVEARKGTKAEVARRAA